MSKLYESVLKHLETQEQQFLDTQKSSQVKITSQKPTLLLDSSGRISLSDVVKAADKAGLFLSEVIDLNNSKVKSEELSKYFTLKKSI